MSDDEIVEADPDLLDEDALFPEDELDLEIGLLDDDEALPVAEEE